MDALAMAMSTSACWVQPSAVSMAQATSKDRPKDADLGQRDGEGVCDCIQER
jgi:hypothetical protein